MHVTTRTIRNANEVLYFPPSSCADCMSQADLFRVVEEGNHWVVVLRPEHLNQGGAAQEIGVRLSPLFEEAGSSDRGGRLSLDFGEVDRITSVGLNELIGISSLTRSWGIQLVLLEVCDTVREVFELTRLERMFEFDSSAVAGPAPMRT